MARVFVTGASGFVARNIRRTLIEDGFEVVSASRRSFEAFGDEIALTTADYTGTAYQSTSADSMRPYTWWAAADRRARASTGQQTWMSRTT